LNIIRLVVDLQKILSHRFNETIVRAYDVRGIYNKTLFDTDAEVFGHVFGLMVGNGKTVNVGFDGRNSSIQLKNCLIKGLLAANLNVNEIGLVPTPLLYFSCFSSNSDAGVMVTGSHNPKDHNGFKIVRNNLPFYGDDLLKLSMKAKKYFLPKSSGIHRVMNFEKKYIKRLFESFKQKLKINVVWDSGNGSAGQIMKKISEKISGHQEILFSKIDGNFPNHHPDPSNPKNLDFCRKEVLEKKLDLGIAFDGDGDRIGVVDDKGRVVSGDNLLLIFALDLLKKKKRIVIGDVKCSQVFFDMVKKFGGKAIMSKTGHSYVKMNMKKFAADLAGEMSGHIFFADRYFGFDDALYASIRLIDLLSNNSKKLSELIDELPKMFNTPEIRIKCDDKIKFSVIEKIVKKQKLLKKNIVDLDGVRVSNNEGWWLIRASNTQPVLVLRCESSSKIGLESQIEEVKSVLKDIDPKFLQKILT